MKQLFFQTKTVLTAVAFITTAAVLFGGNSLLTANAQKTVVNAPENNTPQTLPFSQNWTNAALITANDDWAGVPGIVGFRGDDLTTGTATDPRTLLIDGAGTPVDVNANQTNPDTFTTGGVAEFDGIANPAIALNGSGTADAPHIVVYLNTTGQSNVQFACNIRDLDASADDAVQQVDVQYRVGGSGNYASVAGGYIADATTGGTATQVTALNLTLPAAANNQPLVEVRVMTTNAGGNDEWIGIDDINVTGTPVITNTQHIIDFNGDGKTDWSVVRNTGGGPSGQITWFTTYNGVGGGNSTPWGIVGDFFTPGDFDGDSKTDISIWRAGAPGSAAWYTLQSSNTTVRAEFFGQSGDDPSVIGDYDNDGKDDIAVYRSGAASGDPSFWYWRTVQDGPVFVQQWGQNGDFPAPGDYDGDGKNDFVIQRNAGGGQARFWTLSSAGAISTTVFGTPTDVIVPGDYDGDGKTDLAISRGFSGQFLWWVRPSSGGAETVTLFGASTTDFRTQGDYDGDGKTDIAVWRPGTPGNFYVSQSGGGINIFGFGQTGDYPVANYNTH